MNTILRKIKSYSIICFALLIVSSDIYAKEGEKTNFILIVADDLGYGDLGYTGSTQIATPNIDKLANEGVICTQGYVSSAVCSPSRAGMLTGINQVNFGYDNNLAPDDLPVGFDPEFAGLPIEVPTVATHLKKLGYTTGFMGKWHLGEQEQFHPLNRGFDEMWGFLGGGHDYFKSSPEGKWYEAPIISNYTTPKPITYITDDIGRESCEFIQRHKSDPFFLYVSFNAPHTPFQATAEDMKLFSHIKDKRRQTYLAMIHRMDINVGTIMEQLRKSGVADNTMVIFLSDNGGPIHAKAPNNAPFRGSKGGLLEGGIRVPFIINYPNVLPKGQVYDNPVSSLDITPMLIKEGGGELLESNNFTGVDLLPYLTGEIASSAHNQLFWRFTISAVVREGDWKLIRLPDRLPMLYNIADDKSELNNVALENLDITNKLLKRLGDWDITRPHPRFLEGAIWRKHQLESYDKEYQITQPISD